MLWYSSSTSKAGSTPASIGYSRNIRAQNAWMVEIRARPSVRRARISAARRLSSDSRAIRSSSTSAIRRRMSAVAFSVNVMAAMRSGASGSRPAISPARSATKRCARTSVLPEPAPARTRHIAGRVNRVALLGSEFDSRHLFFRAGVVLGVTAPSGPAFGRLVVAADRAVRTPVVALARINVETAGQRLVDQRYNPLGDRILHRISSRPRAVLERDRPSRAAPKRSVLCRDSAAQGIPLPATRPPTSRLSNSFSAPIR